MRKFDYSFLNNGLLPANLVNLTSSIAELKTMAGVRKEEYAKIFTELEAVAKVQSVKSSNAIEGIVTSDERIAAIVNRDSAPLNHTEGEIAGYRDALNAIHLHHDTLDFKQGDILGLHEALMRIAGYEYGGQYKNGDNYIIEQDKDGNRRIRFKPTPAGEVREAMEQLELAYMDARNNANINQLLLIPCVVLDFLCIHPFRDGNGRMSRLLSLLLLYKNGYDAGKYVSFEEKIKNSLFLSEIFPCESQNQARQILKEQKEKYQDATHVCHAFVCGLGKEIMGMSDDGEPSGTAGRPMLDVVKGRDVTNLILTVTRWFGGTLLGTGGLVKAYGDGAKKVLDKAIEENAFEEYVEKSSFSFSINYDLYDKLKYSIKELHFQNLKEDFSSNITISGQIHTSEVSILQQIVTNLTNGKATVTVV